MASSRHINHQEFDVLRNIASEKLIRHIFITNKKTFESETILQQLIARTADEDIRHVTNQCVFIFFDESDDGVGDNTGIVLNSKGISRQLRHSKFRMIIELFR